LIAKIEWRDRPKRISLAEMPALVVVTPMALAAWEKGNDWLITWGFSAVNDEKVSLINVKIDESGLEKDMATNRQTHGHAHPHRDY